MIRKPTAANTASKAKVSLVSRSRIKNLRPSGAGVAAGDARDG